MTRSRFLTFTLLLAGAIATPPGIGAQTVSMGAGQLEVFDVDGDLTARVDSGADYTAGGAGRTAAVDLRALDGAGTLFFHAFLGHLIVGGASRDGLVLLKDDDGATTTIELEGLTGAIRLGGNGEDGDLIVYDSSDVETARIDGQSATFSNQLAGEGLVKAWARIESDGNVASCWRCDPALTSRFGLGFYRVNFSPLGADVHGRPRAAVIDSHGTGEQAGATIQVYDSPITTSAVTVYVSDFSAGLDRAFTVLVF